MGKKNLAVYVSIYGIYYSIIDNQYQVPKIIAYGQINDLSEVGPLINDIDKVYICIKDEKIKSHTVSVPRIKEKAARALIPNLLKLSDDYSYDFNFIFNNKIKHKQQYIIINYYLNKTIDVIKSKLVFNNKTKISIISQDSALLSLWHRLLNRQKNAVLIDLSSQEAKIFIPGDIPVVNLKIPPQLSRSQIVDKIKAFLLKNQLLDNIYLIGGNKDLDRIAREMSIDNTTVSTAIAWDILDTQEVSNHIKDSSKLSAFILAAMPSLETKKQILVEYNSIIDKNITTKLLNKISAALIFCSILIFLLAFYTSSKHDDLQQNIKRSKRVKISLQDEQKALQEKDSTGSISDNIGNFNEQLPTPKISWINLFKTLSNIPDDLMLSRYDIKMNNKKIYSFEITGGPKKNSEKFSTNVEQYYKTLKEFPIYKYIETQVQIANRTGGRKIQTKLFQFKGDLIEQK